LTTWIFQGNPDIFDIDTYLREYGPIIRWTVRQHANEIKVNDIVFLWRAQGRENLESGIIAKGVIISRPCEMDDDVPHLWRGGSPGRELRVIIELLEIRLTRRDGMIPREYLLEELPKLKILRQPNQTNYKLPPEYACFISILWEKFRPR